MFPIAYAVVEGETKSSWTWFLDIVIENLGIMNQEKWTIISDKQKGLVSASFELLPKSEHRFCVMHLHANLKTAGYTGKVYKGILWNTAGSSNVPHFTNAMKKMKDYKLAAFEWFKDKPPCHWSRSHFSTLSKCDMLLNKIYENFNKCILDAREKPIIGLLEKIIVYLTVRMQHNREKANKWEGKLCPKIKKLLDKYKLDAGNCIPTWLSAGKYEISCIHGEKYTVDLDENTYSCGKWELSGIPCPHAISALVFNEVEPGDYVHECYHVETFKKIYKPIVNPMNGPNIWPDS